MMKVCCFLQAAKALLSFLQGGGTMRAFIVAYASALRAQ